MDAESANLILVAGERRFRAAQLAGLAEGKTGATPYFLFSENRALYRLFRATGRKKIIGSCPPFFINNPDYLKTRPSDMPVSISPQNAKLKT